MINKYLFGIILLSALAFPAVGCAEENGGKVEKKAEVKPAEAFFNDRYADVRNQECDLESVAKVGEKLEYAVKWKGIPAGRISLDVKRKKIMRGREVLQLEMHTLTNDFLSVMYPVDSTVKSYVDARTGQSYLFRRKLREGSRRVDDRLEFDCTAKDDTGKIEPLSFYSKVKNGETIKNAPRPIPGPVQDALSMVYYMRHLKFTEVGQEHQVLVGSKKRTDIVTVKAIKFERRTVTPFGTFDCVVVEPTGDNEAEGDDLVAASGSASIWLEKNTGMPLMLSVNVKIGTATATLIKEENTELKKNAVEEAGITPPEEE